MVSLTTIFAAIFLLASIGFAAGITWISLEEPAHTPQELQKGDGTEGS